MGVLDLFNPILVFRLRLVVYGVLLFFSLFIIIGTASMKNEAKGVDCPLYCDRNSKGYLECASESSCNYPLAIGIIFQLLYVLFRFVTLILVLMGKLNTEGVPFTHPFDLIYVLVDIIACFFTFIGACILSAGTNSTCDNLSGLNKSCENDDYNDWYPGSKAAQAGSWISTFCWLAVGVVGFILLWREGKIPFLPGGGAAKTTSDPGVEPTGPPMETPPSNPDDMSPRY